MKKRNSIKLVTIIISLVLIGLFSFKIGSISESKYDKIILRKISGGAMIMTPIDMHCDLFDAAFSSEIETKDCTKFKKRILTYICKSKPAPEYNNSVDTRSKLLMYNKTALMDSLCLGYTTIFLLNGVSYELQDRSLLDLIDSL